MIRAFDENYNGKKIMMPQALRLALKFSSTTIPSPVLLFQALQVPAGYHAYLAFDTYLITEPRSRNKTVASHFLANQTSETYNSHQHKYSPQREQGLTKHSAFPIENYNFPITSNTFTLSLLTHSGSQREGM